MNNKVHENQLKKDLYRKNLTAAKNIKFLRLISGYSQKEISEMLNMSRGTYFKIECGDRPLDFNTLAILAEIYSVDLNYIISYDICEQILNMIRVNTDSVKATAFLENFFSLSRSGKEDIKAIVYEMAAHEKDFRKFPWGYDEYDSLFDTNELRETRFFYENRFNGDFKL